MVLKRCSHDTPLKLHNIFYKIALIVFFCTLTWIRNKKLLIFGQDYTFLPYCRTGLSCLCNAVRAVMYRAYVVHRCDTRKWQPRKTKFDTVKTTSDVRKTMSDVGKTMSDVVFSTSDLFQPQKHGWTKNIGRENRRTKKSIKFVVLKQKPPHRDER